MKTDALCREEATISGGVAEWLRGSLLALVRIPWTEPLATSQQPNQLFMLPRLVDEYSEVTQRSL